MEYQIEYISLSTDDINMLIVLWSKLCSFCYGEQNI